VAAAAALAAALAPLLSAPVLSDEVFTLDAAALPWKELWRSLQADVHPPLYYLWIKLWLGLFGHSLPALRAFSLLVAACAALAAARVLPASNEGRPWAAWLFAADGIVLMMAVYGRMYTLLALLCVLAWLAADRRLREGGRGWSALAAATVAAGLCTHHFFAFFLAALSLWLAMVHGRSAIRLAPQWVAGLILWGIVWGPTAWQQVTQRPQHLAWVQPITAGKWAEVVGAHLVFTAAALPAALLALAFRRRAVRAPWSAECRAAAAAALAALLLPGIASFWKPVWNPRFTIIASPFLAAALAPAGTLTAGVWPVAALAAGLAWRLWPDSPSGCTSRAAAERLASVATASDLVVFCRLTRKPIEFYWRGSAARRVSFPAEIDSHPGYEGRQDEQLLREEARRLAASATGRVFVVADTGRPASRILLEALREAGFRPQPPQLECADAGKHYFNRLAVFDPPLTRPGSPSAVPPAPGSPPRDRAARAYARP
jgi:hypothetical protein